MFLEVVVHDSTSGGRRIPPALIALMIGAFGIGMTEFIVAGLLPEIGADLGVSLSSAGLLVSGYAAGVAVGAPLLTGLTGRVLGSIGIGNIGAHMERDINLVIDVEPQEAALLIGLIETLLVEWYINRHERQQRMAKLVAVAAEKKADKKAAEKAQQ